MVNIHGSRGFFEWKSTLISPPLPYNKSPINGDLLYGAAGGKVRVAHPLVSLGTATKINIFSRVIYAIAPIPAPHSPVGPLSPTTMHKKTKPQNGALFFYGAAGGNRTHDPILTKDVRYHYATAAKGSTL